MPIKNNSENYQKNYHKSYKRKKRDYSKQVIKQKDFICFDGETENNNYTLLGNSEKYIYDKNGLSSWNCFNFLWNEGKGKIKIIFSIHFDVQYWIKDLSDEKIIDLLNGIEVEFYCYKLRYFTKKFLMIRRGKGTIYIYDIISFFQTSFLKTVEQMKLNLTERENFVLERGKELRSKGFKAMSLDEIIEYNKIECIVAEKVADKLRNILLKTVMSYNGKEFNLLPKKFYGSGAVAKKILKQLEFNKYAENEKQLSDEVKNYIYMSYYGGRFEVFKLGTFKDIYKYDINSAYPYAMTKLFIPNGFKIKKFRNKTEIDFVDTNIYEIEWNFENAESDLIGILPFRRKDGYVIFPKKGKGFYFGIECKYLNELKKITIGEYKVYSELQVSFSEKRFFENGFIEFIYMERLRLKDNNDISQIAYKLAINSIYGKLAQQTGFREFTNVYSASYITAHCRAQILDVIFKNKAIKNVIKISTDGLFTDKEIKKIEVSKQIGHWDKEFYSKAIILGSGLYFLKGKKETYALRGIEVNKENFEKILNKLQKTNSAEIYYNAFIGHKFALANHIKYGKFRLKFAEIKKSVNLYEYQKRYFLKRNGINKISNGLWIDIFSNKKVEYSNKLKKFDEIFELEEEAISLETK